MPAPQVPCVRRYVRKLDERLDEGRGLWFFGERRHRQDDARDARLARGARRGRSVAIYSLPRLLAEIRSTFDDDRAGAYATSSTAWPRSTCCTSTTSAPRRRAAWVLEQLYSIVNDRYEAERAMVITTNLDREQLAEQIGERTVSRLEEMCDRCVAARRRGPRRRIRRLTEPPLSGHAEHRDRRRPVGRRGQGQGRRPARRAALPSSSASRAATTPATRSSAGARRASST